MPTFGALLRAWFLGALLGRDGVERGPGLFHFLTATAGADRFNLFISRKTQDFGEDFLTGVAVKTRSGALGPARGCEG